MSKSLQQLPYTVLGLQNMPLQSRLSNLSNSQTSRRWLMQTVQDFFIFTLKLKAPGYIHNFYLKANNTYKLDLQFRDTNNQYTSSTTITFQGLEQTRIIQVYDHPYCEYIEVKLLNNPSNKMKMGLGYLIIKGKSQLLKEMEMIGQGENKTKYGTQDQRKSHLTGYQSKKSNVVDIDAEEYRKESIVVLDQVQGQVENSTNVQKVDMRSVYVELQSDEPTNKPPNEQKYPQGVLRPIRRPVQTTLSQTQNLLPQSTFSQAQSQHHSPFPIPIHQLPFQIIQPQKQSTPYVTYTYDETGQWWHILQYVNKSWVDGQRNIENQRQIAEEDKMSAKIQIRHFFDKRFIVEGLPPDQRDMIEQTIKSLGGVLRPELETGIIVVSTRDFGQKLKKTKKYKNHIVVPYEYVLYCKQLNVLPDEKAYMIHT